MAASDQPLTSTKLLLAGAQPQNSRVGWHTDAAKMAVEFWIYSAAIVATLSMADGQEHMHAEGKRWTCRAAGHHAAPLTKSRWEACHGWGGGVGNIASYNPRNNKNAPFGTSTTPETAAAQRWALRTRLR